MKTTTLFLLFTALLISSANALFFEEQTTKLHRNNIPFLLNSPYMSETDRISLENQRNIFAVTNILIAKVV